MTKTLDELLSQLMLHPDATVQNSAREIQDDLRELIADAERYRWLRDRPSLIGWDWWVRKIGREELVTPEFLDAEIDNARKG